MPNKRVQAVRLERIRRQVMAGKYIPTSEAIDHTAEWVARVIEGRDRLYPAVAQGVKDQRAINELGLVR